MKQINCNYHPGGPAMLDENAFSPSDRTRVSAPCRACRARMARERDAKVKAGTYVPKTRKWAPHAETATTERITPAHFVRIGGYYFAQGTILLADTLQDGKVVLHTTILEIDGETKHPRNKNSSSPASTRRKNITPHSRISAPRRARRLPIRRSTNRSLCS